MKELFAYDFLSDQADERINLTSAELSKSELRDGDLLFARRSFVLEGAGKCSLVVEPSEALTFESSMIRARPHRDLAHSRFLYYYFKSPVGRGRMASIAARTAVSGITGSNLSALTIDVPDVAEQRRISAVLVQFDELIENSRRRVRVLEQLTRAIYLEWFVRFRYPAHQSVPLVGSTLGPIPKGWEVMPASMALTVNPRVKAPKIATHPFMGMGDLNVQSMICYPSENRSGNSGAKYQNGDTLFARITPSLENGKTGYVQSLAADEVRTGSTEFIVLRGNRVGSAFTYFLARTEEFRSNAIASMVGASGRQRVRRECFDTFLLAVPPVDVAAAFETIAQPIFQEIDAVHRQSLGLAGLRDFLLPRLVAGQIDVSGLDLDALLEVPVA
ncbi:MAG: restriction endonuclease subunit S [Pseudolysinimonas sp.]